MQVSLVFANQSEDDIILKDELDKMEREHGNFKVSFPVLTRKNPCLAHPCMCRDANQCGI